MVLGGDAAGAALTDGSFGMPAPPHNRHPLYPGSCGFTLPTSMENPYAAPESVITTVPVSNTESEQIRQEHLSHEASVKSVGSLYYLGAILLSLGFLAFSRTALNSGYMNGWGLIVGSVLMLGIIVLQWKLATGLRQLRPWVRIPTIVLSIIGLIGFPLGTIISAYILYLMFAPKSKMIFSPEYRQVIADSPHIRYRSSILKTVLIVILVMATFMGLALYFRAHP
jgi:hypothetical protein